MNRWPTKPLGELLKVQNGFAFKSELFNEDRKGVPIIRIRDLARGSSETFYAGEDDPAFVVQNGDFLIGMDGEFRCYRWRGGRALLNQRVCRLQHFSPEINPSYVFHGINDHLREIEANTAFVTVKHLSSKQIANIEMSVPPLAEQQRIVALLDEADELRKLRAQADRRTAALLPALFHGMFGDPAVNPKCWPTRRLRELGAKVSDGPFGSNLKSSHYTPAGVRVIRLQNIGVGCLVDKDRAYISPGHFDSLRKHECLPGDVLVGTLGDPNLRACILPPEIPQALNKADCVQIRPNPEIATAAFICWLLNLPSTLEMASGMILGQTRARISMGRLAELVVPVPPLPLQKEFAERVTEIRALEAEQATSRHRLDALFQSLLHRAFNREL